MGFAVLCGDTSAALVKSSADVLNALYCWPSLQCRSRRNRSRGVQKWKAGRKPNDVAFCAALSLVAPWLLAMSMQPTLICILPVYPETSISTATQTALSEHRSRLARADLKALTTSPCPPKVAHSPPPDLAFHRTPPRMKTLAPRHHPPSRHSPPSPRDRHQVRQEGSHPPPGAERCRDTGKPDVWLRRGH
jgi:hypothetical protein